MICKMVNAMNNNITLKIENIKNCYVNEYDPSVYLTCIIHIYFPYREVEHFSFGANDQVLLKTILTLQNYFNGSLTEDTAISFFAPWHMGKLIIYPCVLYWNSKTKYWRFGYKADHRSHGFDYIYTLGDDQIRSILEQLEEIYRTNDWDTVGKINHYTFLFPQKDFQWCYSANKLCNDIQELSHGKEIKAVYVSSENYFDPLTEKENFVNYLHNDSGIIVVLDDVVIEFLIFSQGTFMTRYFTQNEVQIIGPQFDYIRDRNNEFCDLSNLHGLFKLEYRNSPIESVEVKSINYQHGPSRIGFDYSNVGDPVELPDSVRFILKNGNSIFFAGMDDDFTIGISKHN